LQEKGLRYYTNLVFCNDKFLPTVRFTIYIYLSLLSVLRMTKQSKLRGIVPCKYSNKLYLGIN